MRFFTSLALLALTIAPIDVLAGHIRRALGETAPDSYIVVLKKGSDQAAHINTISSTFSILDTSNTAIVKHRYSRALNGYSAKITGAALQRLAANPDVDYIVPDHIGSVRMEEAKPSRRAVVDAFGRATAQATNGTNGQGVDIYGIDTGIYLAHNDFGGRAVWGATFGGYNDTDDSGHGTHTASTAAGAQYGIAKAANIIAVKVLGASGNGGYSDIIAGIEWVMQQAAASGRPSVANMSLGGPQDSTLDNAVKNAIASGVHFAIAAGNTGTDASFSSPSSVEEANVVGASDSDNKAASFSNIGPLLDVFALGVDVTAAWINDPSDTRVLSGTSMASPRVAGYLATALGKRGRTSPSELTAALVSHAEAVITGQPSNTTDLLAELFS
ncbi:Aqualysin-1; AltName: Full=Aqualysin-I; Flags: Precursor [Serendipita indica DSM 11827]|nr:Aqualysin-1; AltName: Full=Aqualysin-I; Flags: Precursor [Serendipita indica DSM 11827]